MNIPTTRHRCTATGMTACVFLLAKLLLSIGAGWGFWRGGAVQPYT